ncbi:hypothetical protein GCM10009556_013330 [Acrocarpospora pleiomorpha]
MVRVYRAKRVYIAMAAVGRAFCTFAPRLSLGNQVTAGMVEPGGRDGTLGTSDPVVTSSRFWLEIMVTAGPEGRDGTSGTSELVVAGFEVAMVTAGADGA